MEEYLPFSLSSCLLILPHTSSAYDLFKFYYSNPTLTAENGLPYLNVTVDYHKWSCFTNEPLFCVLRSTIKLLIQASLNHSQENILLEFDLSMRWNESKLVSIARACHKQTLCCLSLVVYYSKIFIIHKVKKHNH